MIHYLHHMLFEPVSAWEKFKFDLLSAMAVFLILAIFLGIYCIALHLKGDL